MCTSLGISINREEWSKAVEETTASKRIIEIQPNSLGETHQTNELPLQSSTQSQMTPPSACSSVSGFGRSASARSMPSASSREEANEDLRRENANLKRRLENAQRSLAANKAKLRRLNMTVAKEKAKAKATAGNKSSMDVEKTSKDRNLTISGCLAVGMRMALSSCSALTFPRAAWVDISRYTVARCEVKLAGTVFIRAQILAHLIFYKLDYIRILRQQVHLINEGFIAAVDRLLGFKACKPFLAELSKVLRQGNPRHQLHQQTGAQACVAEANEAESKATISFLECKSLIVGLHELVGLTPPDESIGQVCISGLSLQNDATNSEIWHKKKLTSMVVEASTLVDIASLRAGDYSKAFFSDQFMRFVLAEVMCMIFDF